MPGRASDPGDSLVPFSPAVRDPVAYPLHHGLKPAIAHISISWSRGNSLNVAFFRKSTMEPGDEIGGKVVEVKLDVGDAEIDDARKRRIAYESAPAFALLQSRRNALSAASRMAFGSPSLRVEWWQHVMEYSKHIGSLLGAQRRTDSVIEDPKMVIKDYDSLLSSTETTVHSKLVKLQQKLVNLQIVENDPEYWDGMSSALAVGWLDIVVKLLRLHGSYQLDQIGNRETENGLVEAVAVLVSTMPRMRLELAAGRSGQCFKTKPDFIKAWEKWRGQIAKLDCSPFWVQCEHRQTREGLKILLQVMLGNTSNLTAVTCHWMELYVSHFLYIRPFAVGLEGMHTLAQKCMQLKPASTSHKLAKLLLGILGENTEVVLAECSSSFGPWMVVHAIELLTAENSQAEVLLHEERYNLGGINIDELHRLVYAQVLSSDALTWQITGMHHWKHGKKGAGVFWLKQAGDEVRLNRIAQQLFDFVGKSVSDDSFKQWEGLIELLGSEAKTAGGLEFLHKYRDFKKSLKQVQDQKASDAARRAVESLIQSFMFVEADIPYNKLPGLMKNPSTPERFWLPLLHDSLNLLNWRERPLLNVSETNLLLGKLQELSFARLCPGFCEADLPSQALSSVRLALATNLGRAFLEE
ncbi:hypothetical protein ACLOJK_027037 [Asimina triloba]